MADPTFFLQNLASNPQFDFIESLSGNPDDDDDLYSSSPYESSNFNCSYYDPVKFASEFSNLKNLTIMSINVQSISAKFNELSELILYLDKSKCSPDVICMQELWKIPIPAVFSLPGYSTLISASRGQDVQGGGAVFSSKLDSNLKFYQLFPHLLIVYLSPYLLNFLFQIDQKLQ